MPTVPRAAARAIFRMEGLPLCSKLHVALRQRVTLSIGLPATSHAFLTTTLFAPQKASQAARMRSSPPPPQALKRPKGWRKGAGHRSSWIDARRAAEEYWERWLEEAALRPDVMRLASRSVVKERQRKSGRARTARKADDMT